MAQEGVRQDGGPYDALAKMDVRQDGGSYDALTVLELIIGSHHHFIRTLDLLVRVPGGFTTFLVRREE